MSATFLPSIDRWTASSVPTFGALCTIRRAPLWLVRAWIAMPPTKNAQTKTRIRKSLLLKLCPEFITEFIRLIVSRSHLGRQGRTFFSTNAQNRRRHFLQLNHHPRFSWKRQSRQRMTPFLFFRKRSRQFRPLLRPLFPFLLQMITFLRQPRSLEPADLRPDPFPFERRARKAWGLDTRKAPASAAHRTS